MWNGLLLVDKEPGGTSHDVVQRARRIFKQRKIGHCGTLDPDATGLLVLTLGSATRLTRFLINAPKIYTGHIRFGVSTDTYDAAGTVVGERSTAGLTIDAVKQKMLRFEGTFEQAAPPYSAKKVSGVKYYQLARQGKEVPQAKKEITVFEFNALGALLEDRLEFRLACSSGTYVRSLAHDLGNELGCGAHLESLRRLKVGPFEIEQADRLETISAAAESDEAASLPAWIPLDEIPLPFADVQADAQQEQRIVHGQTILVRHIEGEEGDWIKITNQRKQLIAVGSTIEKIGTAGAGVVQPRIVFR